MTTAIVTLIVGVLIVCVSFFIVDGHNYKEEDELYGETSDELRRRLMDLSDDLYRKYREDVKSLNSELRGKLERSILVELEKYAGQLSEKAKIEMIDYINASLAEAFKEYNTENDREPERITYNPDEEAPVMKLAEEDVPAEDEPAEDISAEDEPAEDMPAEDEPAEDISAEDEPAEDMPAEDEPAEDMPAEDEPAGDISAEDIPAEGTPASEETEDLSAKRDSIPETQEDTEEISGENEYAEDVIEETTEETAEETTVERADESETDEEDIQVYGMPEEANGQTDELTSDKVNGQTDELTSDRVNGQTDELTADRANGQTDELTEAQKEEQFGSEKEKQPQTGGKKKKKKKNKNKNNSSKKEQSEAIINQEEIWDEEKDIEKEVRELSENGYSIMEIANQLGIGVGETKTILDRQK